MTQLLQFAGEHIWISTLFLLLAFQILISPFRLINRFIRSRNIKNAGWPPSHVDADGDKVARG